MLKKISFILIVIIWFSAILISCHKTEPPKAVITITDTSGARVANAKVTVYANPNGSYIDPQEHTLNAIQYTDDNGESSFTFKNKAIFNVKAEKSNSQGNKLLILEEDKTVYLSITIK